MAKKGMLTRKQYKSIKKMDHNDMETWVESIYQSGYNDGRKSVPGIDLEEVKKVILNIKGSEKRKLQPLLSRWMLTWRKKLSQHKKSVNIRKIYFTFVIS